MIYCLGSFVQIQPGKHALYGTNTCPFVSVFARPYILIWAVLQEYCSVPSSRRVILASEFPLPAVIH